MVIGLLTRHVLTYLVFQAEPERLRCQISQRIIMCLIVQS
nr:MAG TPA: hypothetical protein [Caudoviricetes sp.]